MPSAKDAHWAESVLRPCLGSGSAPMSSVASWDPFGAGSKDKKTKARGTGNGPRALRGQHRPVPGASDRRPGGGWRDPCSAFHQAGGDPADGPGPGPQWGRTDRTLFQPDEPGPGWPEGTGRNRRKRAAYGPRGRGRAWARGGFLHCVQATHPGSRCLRVRWSLAIVGTFSVWSRDSGAKMCQTREVPSPKGSARACDRPVVAVQNPP